MTTYRLLWQTKRSCRFAKVSVDVEPAGRTEVEVAATATTFGDYRREAELGARWALRDAPHPVKVIVTDVVGTGTDTGVGDVYEATARAVWQALHVEHSNPYVGFGDPEMVAAWLAHVAGRRLEAVTEARFWHQGRRAPDAESLLHAWLFFEYLMPVRLHGRGDQLLLDHQDPHSSYAMDNDGETKVGPAQPPDLLASFVGERLIDGAVIENRDGRPGCAGLILRFDRGDLVIETLADEWILALGPKP
ncbi:hypothetical protein [Paractinoplanes durhamensis]|uniref:Uncharacterized protein n=1 Tax=Paractinoplanes durhamensis TaxID=113563 RepID=A0ABQ3Z5G4_9ACTN|nr:hypothetical protein [Actinoplanes durhamensis]GIE05073.1 hypothetical protein Adu01nite_64230 [Actinoplanes durhamensis]